MLIVIIVLSNFRYLINKYLGPYLDDSGILEQQIVSADSDISLLNVSLNITKINELLEGSDLPFEFVDGYIGELTVTIPWKDLLKENCFFALDGLTVTLQVKRMIKDYSSNTLIIIDYRSRNENIQLKFRLPFSTRCARASPVLTWPRSA